LQQKEREAKKKRLEMATEKLKKTEEEIEIVAEAIKKIEE
jgi:hypothetical protein